MNIDDSELKEFVKLVMRIRQTHPITYDKLRISLPVIISNLEKIPESEKTTRMRMKNEYLLSIAQYFIDDNELFEDFLANFNNDIITKLKLWSTIDELPLEISEEELNSILEFDAQNPELADHTAITAVNPHTTIVRDDGTISHESRTFGTDMRYGTRKGGKRKINRKKKQSKKKRTFRKYSS
jgi:hypothetical protein